MYDLILKKFNNGNFDEANDMAFKIYNKNKKNDRICRIIGEIYLKKNTYKESEKFFKKAIKLKPNKNYYFSLGNLYLQQKYYKKAKKLFEKTIIKDKNDSVAINNLAFCHFKI